jgi:hypothetical protein
MHMRAKINFRCRTSVQLTDISDKDILGVKVHSHLPLTNLVLYPIKNKYR